MSSLARRVFEEGLSARSFIRNHDNARTLLGTRKSYPGDPHGMLTTRRASVRQPSASCQCG